MIDPKKWKRYKDMRTLEQSMAVSLIWQAYKDETRRLEKRRKELKATFSDGAFMGLSYDFFVPPPSPAPPTVENFLDWMANGEPTLARKLKVS